MKIRRFNSDGIQQVNLFLDSLTTAEPLPYREALLDDPSSSDIVEPGVDAERRVFADRFELAEYLNSLLGESGIGDIAEDRGLWAWLSFFFFDQLCPDEAGRRKPGERARWIPAVGDFRKYYRHLLAGPFRIFRAHRQNPPAALALLCTPPHKPGDLVEQLTSRQELVTNSAIVQAATSLYVDPATPGQSVGRPDGDRGASEGWRTSSTSSI